MGIQDPDHVQSQLTFNAYLDRGTMRAQQDTDIPGHVVAFAPKEGGSPNLGIDQHDPLFSLLSNPYDTDMAGGEKVAVRVNSCALNLPIEQETAIKLGECLEDMKNGDTAADKINAKAEFVRTLGSCMYFSGISSEGWKPELTQGTVTPNEHAVSVHSNGVFSLRTCGDVYAGDTVVAMVPLSGGIQNNKMEEHSSCSTVTECVGFHAHPRGAIRGAAPRPGLVLFAIPALPVYDDKDDDTIATYHAVENLRSAYFEAGFVVGKSLGKKDAESEFTYVSVGTSSIGILNTQDARNIGYTNGRSSCKACRTRKNNKRCHAEMSEEDE